MSPPSNPLPILPPIVTLSSLSQAVDAAESPSTVATVTPATADILSTFNHTSTQRDYFGDGWSSRSPTKQMAGMKRPAPSQSPRANKPSPIKIDNSTSPGSPGPPESVYSPRTVSRLKHASRRISQNGHHRHRDDTKKGSGTTEGESSASDNRARDDRVQKRKAPSQKAMLSKALQKAHHAVTLDQHSNFEGAMHAYQDACALLQKVMIRSSGIEDRQKLDAVRNTYEARIAELRGTDLAYRTIDGKTLPQRPPERDSKDSERLSMVTDTDDGETTVGIATMASLGNEQARREKLPHLGQLASLPPRRQSLQTNAYRAEGRDIRTASRIQDRQPLRARYKGQDTIDETHLYHGAVYQEYMPPPLSPRRPLSPAAMKENPTQSSTDVSAQSAPDDDSNQSDSIRQDNGEHTSWLNTINESSGSSASSVHSRRSSVGLRRKHIRAASGQTEAEFDAALDAAVEAAYDDGFEPDDEGDYDEQLMNDPDNHFEEPRPLSHTRRDVELAKENVREAEREAAISRAKERERERLQGARDSVDLEYNDDETDEEERMLEEMTRDYIMDDEYDLQTKSALPRQSDSSGFSGRTWISSFGSNPTSAGTSLSTVAEAPVLPSMAAQLKENPLPPPLHPPPSSALPPPPLSVSSNNFQQSNGSTIRPPSLVSRNTSPGVRERRLSGVKRKPLKIETYAKHSDTSESEAPRTQPAPVAPRMITTPAAAEPPKSALPVPESQQLLPSLAFNPAPSSATLPSSRKGSSPFPGSDTTDQTSSNASALTRVTSADSDNSVPSMPGSPARFAGKAATGLRKNFSSSSLRNKNLTVVVPETHDASSNASLSSLSSTPKQQRVPSPAVPILPTPMEASFIIKGQPMGGPYLFDNDIHSPNMPGSPNPSANNAPLPLEPCPESALLRPFWCLRSIYQTIAHPRGGYISSRLFVPRDIWRVKNIKLKNVEEKISSCDYLTAALLKLGKVDNLDANAVKDEMEFFETVMEQVHSSLSKKLGSDVGVQGATQLFKSFGAGDETAYPEALASKTTNASSKSYLSWRKLRNKNSLGPGLPSVSSNNATRDGSKEAPTLRSIPMTSAPNPRFSKRDVNQVQCVGPNPSYMGSLARLCDAAQVLDQIIRQVEDPGLKHSSQTHVGLELSARHAAEFFGFIVCRFVLTDIGIMLDKFIKRGSEWVLA
ncbi:MAG: hypothetical protein ASARMPREDX12_009429 [Alectoria sarmentosa]|nr:MAG: hypothetical protein ASARMPREDX12_009429 [Alectoria sarmentosa]